MTRKCSFLVAMGDISLRKLSIEEKRAKVEKDSKVLLDYTRKAIARLTYLKRYFLKEMIREFLLHYKKNLLKGCFSLALL